jgi:hypothetical protein
MAKKESSAGSETKEYTVPDLGNGYPVADTKKHKPTKVRGSGAAKKGFTAHGPMC